MFDIGWTELLVIAVVLIVVVGPKDLPPMLRAFGKMTANLRKMAGDFRTQFDEALRESELDDVRRTLSDAQRLNPTNALREAINPLRQMGQDIRSDLQKATQVPSAPEVSKTDIEAQQAVEGAAADPIPEIPVSASVASTTPVPVMPVTSAPMPSPVVVNTAAPAPEKPKRARKAPVVAQSAAEPVALEQAEKLKRVTVGRKATPAPKIDAAVEIAAAIEKPRRRVAKKTDTPKDDA
ncbi:twin-arginine translocase subunit TatB [Neorhizobium lilium]|uniref:Sec-independent protein translocase protein TatB n=1 Tax=Neorhizobium lilium TaxID=2503024 RepID=A0A3S3S3B5_9HYPH|nr:Sec-independent protein translocase protein TatB [Neorhizobium lilium]RWX75679.1 twin-arginine translocase subunit TatB [Neorhizobium lilium]